MLNTNRPTHGRRSSLLSHFNVNIDNHWFSHWTLSPVGLQCFNLTKWGATTIWVASHLMPKRSANTSIAFLQYKSIFHPSLTSTSTTTRNLTMFRKDNTSSRRCFSSTGCSLEVQTAFIVNSNLCLVYSFSDKFDFAVPFHGEYDISLFLHSSKGTYLRL